jgi:transposase-like protein
MNSRHGVRERWSRIVELQEKSGQSVRVFCQERSLSEPSFYSWRQRLRKDHPDRAVSFALVDTKNTAADTTLEVVLQNGDRLRIPRDPATLRKVLSVLRERP